MLSRLTASAAALLLGTLTIAIAPSSATATPSPTPTLGILMGGFDDPAGMAIDPQGTTWVANNQSGSVQPVPAGDTLQSQLPAAATGLRYPADVAIDAAGDVFVSEQGGTTVEELPEGGGAPIVFHGFVQPAELAVDPSGNVWVANSAGSTIQEIPAGATASTTLPTPISGMDHPNGIVVDGSGNLWVSNTGGNTIQEVPAGATSATTLPTPIGGFSNPYAAGFDQAGNLWVTNDGNNTVQQVPAGATSLTTLPTAISGFNQPTDITLAPNGDLWVSNTGGNTIQVLAASTTSASTLPAAIGGFNGPFGVAFTSTCSAWVSNVGQSFNGTGTSIQQVNSPLGCPSSPSDLTATPGNAQATVTWDPSTAPSYAVSGYNVVSVPGGFTCSTASSPTPSCVVTGLTNGTSYTFDVVAINGVGDSGVAVSPAAMPTASLLAAPSLIGSSVSNRTASVTWSAPPTPPSILYYVATATAVGATPQGTILLPSATSVTFSGLVNGAAYTLTVLAIDASGAGDPLTVQLTPVAAPGPVRSLAVRPARRSLIVTWGKPASNGGAAITGYDVYVGRSPSTISARPRNAHPLSSRSSKYVIADLQSKVRYFVVVRAVNRIGVGARSRTIGATTH